MISPSDVELLLFLSVRYVLKTSLGSEDVRQILSRNKKLLLRPMAEQLAQEIEEGILATTLSEEEKTQWKQMAIHLARTKK